MIKVIINQREGQPDCWYINESSDIGMSAGKIGYKSWKEAAATARHQHPYVNIDIQE